MKTLIIAMALLPTIGHSQNYIARENNGKLDVYPTKGEIRLGKTSNGRSCEIIKTVLKGFEQYPSEDEAKKLEIFDTGWGATDWGETSKMMSIWLKNYDFDSELIKEVSEDTGRNRDEINVMSIDFDKAKLSRKTIVKNPENVFVKALMKYKGYLPGTIQVKYNGVDYLRVNGRLAYCAFYEDGLGIEIQFEKKFVEKKSVQSNVVASLFSMYKDVASAWKKEEKKVWANNLHKLLQIGVILKEKGAGKIESEHMTMNQAFDKFFDVYNKADGDEGISVYLKNFHDQEIFKNVVMPDLVNEFTVSGTLTEQE